MFKRPLSPESSSLASKRPVTRVWRNPSEEPLATLVQTSNKSGDGQKAAFSLQSSISINLSWLPHEYYFFEDGNFVVLVEQTLFRLHQSLIQRHSSFFADIIYTKQTAAGLIRYPFTLQDPCKLDVSEDAFTKLLYLIHPKVAPFDSSIGTLEYWNLVLNLAHRFKMPIFVQECADVLLKFPLEPCSQLKCTAAYGLGHAWSFRAYEQLCTQTSLWSTDQASDIKSDILIRLTRAREFIQKTPVNSDDKIEPVVIIAACFDLQPSEFDNVLEQKFVPPEEHLTYRMHLDRMKFSLAF